MAKIRGFKPDLWTDEDFVEVSPFARLLWMGMWNFACDNGHLPDKSKQIKMRVLPTDDVNCAELLRELEGQGLIERDNGWITVPNLTRHQKPDKRWWQACEKPGCTKPSNDSQHGTRSGNAEARSGQKGPRAELSGVDGELSRGDQPAPAAADVEFEEFWDQYPRKVGKAKAASAYAKARVKAHADTISNGLAKHLPVWAETEEKFIPHATTWLNGERWQDSVSAPAPKSDGPRDQWARAIVVGGDR